MEQTWNRIQRFGLWGCQVIQELSGQDPKEEWLGKWALKFACYFPLRCSPTLKCTHMGSDTRGEQKAAVRGEGAGQRGQHCAAAGVAKVVQGPLRRKGPRKHAVFQVTLGNSYRLAVRENQKRPTLTKPETQFNSIKVICTHSACQKKIKSSKGK